MSALARLGRDGPYRCWSFAPAPHRMS